MLSDGNFFWNTGIYLFKCKKILELAEKITPLMLQSVRKSYLNAHVDMDFVRLEKEAWAEIKSNSIDYEIIERAKNIVMYPLQTGWSDLGSWRALLSVLSEDKSHLDSSNNILIGNTSQVDSNSCLVWSQSGKQLITVVGVEDIVVVLLMMLLWLCIKKSNKLNNW